MPEGAPRVYQRAVKVGPLLVASVVCLTAIAAAQQEDPVSPEEVVHKAHQVPGYLSRAGADSIAVFNRQQSRYVWGDTYVFVFDCARKRNVAHPISPYLIGQ